MAQIDLSNTGSVSTPATGTTTVYIDSTTKKLKSKDDAGNVTDYSAAGNSITSLTGEVTATGPGAASATIDNDSVIAKTLTGFSSSTGVVTAADSILSAIQKIYGNGDVGWFGSASDGNVTISVDTTLVRDMFYDTLTINSGATLFTAGFRVFAKTAIVNNGIINRSGNNASGVTAGAALTAGTLGSSGAGGAGGTAAGAAGGAVTNSLGGAGGTGGSGSGGAGGTAGSVTVPTAATGGVESFNAAARATMGQTLAGTTATGGAGGSGGGGDGTAGGGGGSGGGVMMLASLSITGTGTFEVHGGAGGTPAAGNRGGGGGGGGGCIILVSANSTLSLTTAVNGGIGSSGTGTGTTGASGSVGRVIRVRTV